MIAQGWGMAGNTEWQAVTVDAKNYLNMHENVSKNVNTGANVKQNMNATMNTNMSIL